MDDDGLPDVLTESALFINQGNRTFEEIDLPAHDRHIVASGRFEGGRSQLLAISLTQRDAAGSVHTLSPDLRWSSRELTVPVVENVFLDSGPTWVVADLDGDGTDELVVGSETGRGGCGL